MLGDIQTHIIHKADQPSDRRQDILRFFEKITVKESGCWEWTESSRDGRGYGLFFMDKQSRRAHRVMAYFCLGRWTDDEVLHTCDNPPCCNPNHLVEGSHAENMADMKAKGRGRTSPGRKGSGNPAAKLTEVQVAEIRHKYASGEYLQRVLAEEYGVAPSRISLIVNEKVWVS